MELQTYGVSVTGIDLSTNMTSIALEKADKINDHRVCILIMATFSSVSYLVGMRIPYCDDMVPQCLMC